MAERKRAYRSELREQQARATRSAVLDAATRCFVEHGYAGTTVRDVAAAAGVSAPTVFAQGGKPALLLAAVDRAVVGDDEQVPLAEREQFEELVAAPGRARRLAALRALAVRHTTPELRGLMRTFAAAAESDPQIAAAWREYGRRRYQDMRAMVAAFAAELRPGLDVDRATDVYWSVFTEDTGRLLVDGRGWTVEEYADWLVDAFARLLLR